MLILQKKYYLTRVNQRKLYYNSSDMVFYDIYIYIYINERRGVI